MNNAQTHLKMGYVWTICLVAACGGLLFGYDWVVIGGAKPFYEAWFSITDPAQSGWAMSSALLGCIFRRINFGMVRRQTGAQAAINSFRRAVQRVGLGDGGRQSFRYVCGLPHCGRRRDWSGFRSQPALHCRSQSGREKRAFCRGQSAHHRDWRAGRSVNQSDDC